MRAKPTLLVLAAQLLASPVLAQPRETVRVEVHLDRPQASLGMPMPAKFRLGGPGLGREGVAHLKVIVRTENGEDLPDPRETSFAEDLHELRTADLSVGPDGIMEISGDLNDWAAFRGPGRYHVIVTHEVPGAPPIRSQPMLVTVEQRREADMTRHYERLVGQARNERPGLRAEAMRQLGWVRNREALPILVEALYDDDVRVGQWAAASLSRLPDVIAARAALRTARVERGISGPLVAALFRGGERVIGVEAALRKAADSAVAQMRRRSVEAAGVIGRLGPTVCASKLLPLLRQGVSDRDETVVQAAFDALARWRDAGSRELLQSHAVPGPMLERAAVALASRRDPESRQILREALRHRDVAVRMAAARVLWHVGDRSGRGAFIAVLRARDAAAKEALMGWLARELPLENIPEASAARAEWWLQIVQRMP